MKTFATPTLYDEMELPSDLDFIFDYEQQPVLGQEYPLITPDTYLLQDFSLANSFIPLTDLVDCDTSGSLNVTHLKKAPVSSRAKEGELLTTPIIQPEPVIVVAAAVPEQSVEQVKTEPEPEHEEAAVVNVASERHNKVRRKRYNCSVCKYHAQQPDALKIHMKTFHGDSKPFKCNQCNFITTERSDFMSHLITHHKQERYSCDKCDYGANRMFLMKLHMMTHNGEIPFKCSDCDYNTLYKKKLKEHMWLHTKDRPFKCTQCNYVGLNSKSLSYHVAKKHKLK